MSYQVFARKWRPQVFSDVIGQKHILKALINGLDSQRIHHAYLFTGTRGVGKTTLARVVAKALNCEKGISSLPCGQCASCVGFDKGQFVDLIEVDAASRTKVEETRELLDNVQYLPTSSRFKIYLIDEVHMFSNHSFNALLKTLEEPPEHVKFLLATTDPKKVPITVLSRCLQFNLLKVEKSEIGIHLSKLLEREGVKYEQNGLDLLAKSASGSVRDALSLLDQAVSHGGGQVTQSSVTEMLGLIDKDVVITILKCLALNQPNRLIAIARDLRSLGLDYAYVLAEILSLLVRVASVHALDQAAEQLEDDQEIHELASLISSENCQLFYQIALVGRKDLALSPDPESAFEMTLLRILSFRLCDEVSPVNLEANETSSEYDTAVAKKKDVTTESLPEHDTKVSVLLDTQQHSQPATQTDVVVKFTPLTSNDDWHRLLESLEVTGLARELYRNTVYVARRSGELDLYLSSKHEKLAQPNALKTLEEKISRLVDEALKINLVALIGDRKLSLADQTMANEEKAQSDAEKNIRQDANVMLLMDEFGATLENVSRDAKEEKEQ